MRQSIVKREARSLTRPRNMPQPAVVPLQPQGAGPVAEDAVRLRAYQRWEEAGKPDGDVICYWLEAERELSQSK